MARLSCPCGTRTSKKKDELEKEDARMQPKFNDKEKIIWKMYGKGSNKFNYHYDDDYSNPLQFTAPTVRYYYRTFRCQVKGSKKYHYINMFSRPTGYTTFPVMFPYPGIGDHPYDPIECKLQQYYRGLDGELEEKDTYYGAPYQFYWKFPDPANRKLETDKDELFFQRPPTGPIYWGEQLMNVKDQTASSVYKPHVPTGKVKVAVGSFIHLSLHNLGIRCIGICVVVIRCNQSVHGLTSNLVKS